MFTECVGVSAGEYKEHGQHQAILLAYYVKANLIFIRLSEISPPDWLKE